MQQNAKIYVAGHRGLVGSAIVNNLRRKGYHNLVLRSHAELDLTQQQPVADFFAREKPDYVILAAAKVGGILANNRYRGEFIYANLAIQNNVIHQSYCHGVEKLLFLGSTCIYPKHAPQPMPEHSLLTSPLEYTNEPYAIAKIAGIKLCESYNLQYGTNFISVMPTNLYGKNDNFDLQKSHVLPALLRKMHLAKLLQQGKQQAVLEDLQVDNAIDNTKQATRLLADHGVNADAVKIWGSGKPRREFLHSEDMADACVFLLQKRNFSDLASKSSEVRNTHINIGTGKDISIADLAKLIAQLVGYSGQLQFDSSKPDGTLIKLTDPSKLHSLGWQHQIELAQGIQKVYEWYQQQR